jgi:hypothetical protein
MPLESYRFDSPPDAPDFFTSAFDNYPTKMSPFISESRDGRRRRKIRRPFCDKFAGVSH